MSSAAAPPAFTGSLPSQIKTGMEALSGIAMDSVRVHYNSPEPARVQAVAYTQGTDIHVAPGQEQHLPHEAWHVVQQQQGRVQPTMQLAGTAINDDSSLEQEADAMGAKALSGGGERVQPGLTAQRNGQTTVQRLLNDMGSQTLETPIGAISTELKILGKDVNLPGPVRPTERARKVSAVIENNTLRKDERGKSSNLATVTAMARAEEVILQGAEMQKFYDAGHLVGDQLVGGTDDSFKLWNLAPQAMEFNAPTYFQIVEEEIRKQVEDKPVPTAAQPTSTGAIKKQKLGTATTPSTATTIPSNKKVELEVEVSYPDDYTVKVEDLVKRGVLSPDTTSPTEYTIKGKQVQKDQEIEIPRRIPNRWRATSKLFSTTSGAPIAFDPLTKAAGKGELAEHFIAPVATPDLLPPTNPIIGTPFFFTVTGAKKELNTLLQKDELVIPQAQERTFTASQWSPAEGGPREIDIVSHMAKTFPDLDSKEKIINRFSPGILKEHEILTQSMDAIVKATAIGNELLVKILPISVKVQSELASSKVAGLSLEKQSEHLKKALEFSGEMQQLIEDHKKAQQAPPASQAPSPFFTHTLSLSTPQPTPPPASATSAPAVLMDVDA